MRKGWELGAKLQPEVCWKCCNRLFCLHWWSLVLSRVSVCADNNHVRTWTVTRFRGMISTQPGSTPLASFKILSLEETESHGSYCSGNDIGEGAGEHSTVHWVFYDENRDESGCSGQPCGTLYTVFWIQVHLERGMISRCSYRRSSPSPTNCLWGCHLQGRGRVTARVSLGQLVCCYMLTCVSLQDLWSAVGRRDNHLLFHGAWVWGLEQDGIETPALLVHWSWQWQHPDVGPDNCNGHC